MDVFFGALVGLIILIVLVVVHELGHAIMARRSGVVVEEFGVGFPPRAYKKKLKNGVLFSLNWLPLGGFVKLQGEHDAADGKGDYGAASFLNKTKILFGGVAMNWLFAIVIMTVLSITGMPVIIENQFAMPGDTKTVNSPVEITYIFDNYPAKKAGLQVGDHILSFNDQEVSTAEDLIKNISNSQNQTATLDYERGGVSYEVQVSLGAKSENGVLGAGLGQSSYTKSTWSAPIVGVSTTAQFTWATLKSIGDMFTGGLKEVSNNVAGPVGILGTIFPAAVQSGLTQLSLLAAIISISLAVMNMLPIPALDGGRWFTMAIFKLARKKLTKEREEKIQTVGFVLIMALAVLVTISDVSKIF